MLAGGAARGRRALGLAAVSLTAVVVVACSGGSGTEVRGAGDEAPVDVGAAGTTATPLLDLALDLERQLAAAGPGADVAVAPLPVAVSLSQARSGAGGSTAEEIDRVLHTPVGADGADQLSRVTAGDDPARVAAGRELLDAVRAAMTEEERAIADLRGRGCTWAEVAERLGGTAEARRKQFDRTLDRVSATLGLDEGTTHDDDSGPDG